MTYFWRLFLSVIIAVCVNFGTDDTNSLAITTTPTIASEFLRLGVEKMQQGDYQEAIQS